LENLQVTHRSENLQVAHRLRCGLRIQLKDVETTGASITPLREYSHCKQWGTTNRACFSSTPIGWNPQTCLGVENKSQPQINLRLSQNIVFVKRNPPAANYQSLAVPPKEAEPLRGFYPCTLANYISLDIRGGGENCNLITKPIGEVVFSMDNKT